MHSTERHNGKWRMTDSDDSVSIMLTFHDTDIDTNILADILARIVAP